MSTHNILIDLSNNEPELQEVNVNDHDYMKIYTHLELETYKDWIKNILPNISGAYYIRKDNHESSEYKLNERYIYHCNGNPRSTTGIMKRVIKPLSDRNFSHPIQKLSKKLGYKSYLRVLKRHNEKGNAVHIIHYTFHNGHTPGTDEDLRYLRISQQAKKWIHERAKDEMKPSQIVSIFHQRINQFHETENLSFLSLTQKRDMYLSYIDMYNIIHEEIKNVIFLGSKETDYNESTSIKEWVILSKEDGSHICSNLVWESSLGFMFRFQTEFQKNMLKSKSAQTVCIDGTHGTTSHKTNLFTLLICDNEGEQGVPIAHLISERKAEETLIIWLKAIKSQNQEWESHTFLTDCDDAQQNAISNGNYLETREKNENNDNLFKQSEKQVIQKVALDELGAIMRIRDISQMQSKFDEYFAW
ncbi:6043_t:CDS:2 [Ambispora gerdemannii]|uniref:6043_t:CDS:1 n=1 Tax=Ambispora gerdemannii TaxID=144530 RepID=A0A9N9H726_9GLOM|nr:6043_t:CDS:2 [Ambispora gerdemannii]